MKITKKIFAIVVLIFLLFLSSCNYRLVSLSQKKEEAIYELNCNFDKLNESFYSEKEWDAILSNKDYYINSINECNTKNDVDNLLLNYKNYIEEKIKKQVMFLDIEDYHRGNGTKEDPYIIINEKQLLNLSKDAYCDKTLNKYYALGKNINLKNFRWITIGYDENRAFEGVFDGCGYIVENINLYLYGLTNGNNGVLFGYNRGTIKNVGVENFKVECIWNNIHEKISFLSGSICCYNNGFIDDCYAIGTMQVEYSTDNYYFVNGNKGIIIGGISGINKKCISNCYSMVNISVDYNYYNIDEGIKIAGISNGNGYVYNSLAICKIIIKSDFLKTRKYIKNASIGGSQVNCYGYYDEITSGDMRDYDEMNRYCDEKDLNDIDFYRGKLGWDTEIWNLNNIYFKAGEYLKNSYPKLYNYSHRR
ncbi:MAG: hypothetical protein IJS58_04955 [Bacilli bacterium]|nr:hypothetical protein [Bacilli bacterium]